MSACTAPPSGGQANDRPAAVTAPAQPAPLAEARLESPPLLVRLTGAARTTSTVLTLSFVLSNPDPATPVTLGAIFAASPVDAGSLADAYVFDEAHQKKYFVMRNDEGRAACSPDVGPIPPGQERAAWCRFPAPPVDVQRATVGVPHLAAFRDVPISGPARASVNR
jgi:hypothetical protein